MNVLVDELIITFLVTLLFFSIILSWYIFYHCYIIEEVFMKKIKYQEKKILEIQELMKNTYLLEEGTICIGGDDEWE